MKNVEFDDSNNDFLKDLEKICKDIDKENNVILPADKTTNFYKVSSNDYNNLMDKNIYK